MRSETGIRKRITRPDPIKRCHPEAIMMAPAHTMIPLATIAPLGTGGVREAVFSCDVKLLALRIINEPAKITLAARCIQGQMASSIDSLRSGGRSTPKDAIFRSKRKQAAPPGDAACLSKAGRWLLVALGPRFVGRLRSLVLVEEAPRIPVRHCRLERHLLLLPQNHDVERFTT